MTQRLKISFSVILRSVAMSLASLRHGSFNFPLFCLLPVDGRSRNPNKYAASSISNRTTLPSPSFFIMMILPSKPLSAFVTRLTVPQAHFPFVWLGLKRSIMYSVPFYALMVAHWTVKACPMVKLHW